MPHLTLDVGTNGPILNVMVGVSEARAVALAAARQPIPRLVATSALVDTGASHSCVDPSIVRDLGLTPTGSVEVTAPSGDGHPRIAEQYDVSLTIPAGIGESPLIFPTLPVFCSDLHNSGAFNALIGRDVLASCLLSYNGRTGLFTLAY